MYAWHHVTIDEHRVPAVWQVPRVMTSCGMSIEECSVGYSSLSGLLMSWWSSVAQLRRCSWSSNPLVNQRTSLRSKSRLASRAYCAPRSAFTAACQQETSKPSLCYTLVTMTWMTLHSESESIQLASLWQSFHFVTKNIHIKFKTLKTVIWSIPQVQVAYLSRRHMTISATAKCDYNALHVVSYLIVLVASPFMCFWLCIFVIFCCSHIHLCLS